MTDPSEVTLHHEPQASLLPSWIERFANKEHYSPFSLAVLEACKVFFSQHLSLEQREQLEQMHATVLVTGSLLRGNARPGSDIDLILVLNSDQTAGTSSDTNITINYQQASELLNITEVKQFVVEYLEQNYPELYERLFEVKLADFNQRVERFILKRNADPDKYSKDPNYWGNLPPEKRGQYVKENFLAFYVEVGIFDVHQNIEDAARNIDTDDLIHGFISLLFSSDLQTIVGDRNSARNTLLSQLKAWRDTNPDKFKVFYDTLQKGLESFLSYTGKNHFYLDDLQNNNQKIEMPSLDQLLQQ